MPSIKIKFDKYRHKKNKWVTDEIIAVILERDNMYKLHKMTNPDSSDYDSQIENLKVLNCKVKKLIRDAKKDYYTALFTKLKSDIKATWKTIKEILNKSKKKELLPQFFPG